MEQIKISLLEVRETASRIRQLNMQMYESLTELKNMMNDTNVSWLSEGGSELRSKFLQLSSRFDIQKDEIESYAKFLEHTANSYETLETTIKSNASSMQI